MRLKINVFLLKEGLQKEDILARGASPTHRSFTAHDTTYDFHWKISQSTPEWLNLFNGIGALQLPTLRSYGIQGLLVFEKFNRVFCYTFGHARHLINPLHIVRYFGLITALNLSDPELIKSIDKIKIDKTPLSSRSQSSKYVSISDFEFAFDWEILKSLTGIVDSDNDNQEVISGSDSISLHTDIDFDGIPALTERLWEAFNQDTYKEKYPWIDYIVPVRDKVLINTLDQEITIKICDHKFNEVWIAPPKLIDYENFEGFGYKRRRSSPVTHPDLDLRQCLCEKGYLAGIETSNIKTTKITLYNSDYSVIDTWPLYKCLNGEVEIDSQLYLLNDGDWYQIDRSFSDSINRYFDGFPRSDIHFPHYQGKHEGDYLTEIADSRSFYLMDRKLIKPSGAASHIEFCDLLTHDHHIIHVKKYSSSSVLSHLFSQAYVSAEVLLNSPDVISQINNHLSENEEYRFQFDINRHQRQSKIILAIMQKRQDDIHMPFFSKVNFKQYSQKLVNMGFNVELAQIPDYEE